jgi:hypothetical protein
LLVSLISKCICCFILRTQARQWYFGNWRNLTTQDKSVFIPCHLTAMTGERSNEVTFKLKTRWLCLKTEWFSPFVTGFFAGPKKSVPNYPQYLGYNSMTHSHHNLSLALVSNYGDCVSWNYNQYLIITSFIFQLGE